jgi:predicted dehydrogenase
MNRYESIKALVIGYGSIGARHVDILSGLGCDVHVVTKQNINAVKTYRSVELALDSNIYDYIVIATETVSHISDVEDLISYNYRGILMVEKPIFKNHIPFPSNKFKAVYVGYNLRYHPALVSLKHAIAGQKILFMQCYAGQYLPSWRPKIEYKLGYSSSRLRGGGVLRDLSHELDFLWQLGGKPDWFTSIGGKFSHLDIDSDDLYGILYSTTNCPLIQVNLNYLDKKKHRFLIVQTDVDTYKVDLIKSTLYVGDKQNNFSQNRNDTYILMHQDILSNDGKNACVVDDALGIVKWIEQIEFSSFEKKWLKLR